MKNTFNYSILLTCLNTAALSQSLLANKNKSNQDERPNIVFSLIEDLSPQYIALFKNRLENKLFKPTKTYYLYKKDFTYNH